MFSVPKEKVILLVPFPGIVFYNSLADRIKKKICDVFCGSINRKLKTKTNNSICFLCAAIQMCLNTDTLNRSLYPKHHSVFWPLKV